jgi:hypothetical protein
MSKRKSIINLFFLGNRQYVQAPIQLRFALEHIIQKNKIKNLSEIYVNRYKQIKEVKSPLAIYPINHLEAQNRIRATITITLNDKLMEYKLVSIPGELERRPDVQYKQVQYHIDSDTEARVLLAKAKDFWEVLDEAVELTKLFHIDKYNLNINFRFIVGGFERLRYFETSSDETMIITCRIMRHIFHKNTIYNFNRIEVKSNSTCHSFLLPFIGKVSKK